jgi:hypothetical protein
LGAGKLPLANAPTAPALAAAMGGGAGMAVTSAPPAPDPAQLQATLGSAISGRTLAMVAASAEPLRAAMLLGSPDFMQR